MAFNSPQHNGVSLSGFRVTDTAFPPMEIVVIVGFQDSAHILPGLRNVIINIALPAESHGIQNGLHLPNTGEFLTEAPP